MRQTKYVKDYVAAVAKITGESEKCVNAVLMHGFRKLRYIMKSGNDIKIGKFLMIYSDKRLIIWDHKNYCLSGKKADELLEARAKWVEKQKQKNKKPPWQLLLEKGVNQDPEKQQDSSASTKEQDI